MERMDLSTFQWMNESTIEVEDGVIRLYAPGKSDFFIGGGSAEAGILPDSLLNAPFYYTEVTGDFVMRARVSHAFKDTYDSATLMIMAREDVWAKACFELTDFGTRAAVSVVTSGVSDDANGVNVLVDKMYLQAARLENNFAFHYSLDGETYYMTRYFTLPVGDTVRIGLVAQAPQGSGGDRYFEEFSIENRKVQNLREGK